MTAGGWLFMIVSVGGVIALFSWCMWKVMTTPGESEHIHGFNVDEETLDKE
ncbi:hypothetical protein [Cerasicoccus frondis]|uniref:hypothetical protein n=1 Tax=Cerasicoccus frondis TaxID=490090 RepID=UPI0028527F4C|nr:hypothetical protein [Cerasicoccus frondis]